MISFYLRVSCLPINTLRTDTLDTDSGAIHPLYTSPLPCMCTPNFCWNWTKPNGNVDIWEKNTKYTKNWLLRMIFLLTVECYVWKNHDNHRRMEHLNCVLNILIRKIFMKLFYQCDSEWANRLINSIWITFSP